MVGKVESIIFSACNSKSNKELKRERERGIFARMTILKLNLNI
jgi:hypothetical protein